MRPGPRARWSMRRAMASLTAEQFDRLKAELERELPGRRQRRPAAGAGGRARLEGDGLQPQGDGLHRGQERRGARDRAGLRRAADAARHSGRQYLCQLCRGQPRLLAADRGAAGQPRGRGHDGWLHRSAGCGSATISTRSRRCRRTARRCGRASARRASSPTRRSVRRWGMGRRRMANSEWQMANGA